MRPRRSWVAAAVIANELPVPRVLRLRWVIFRCLRGAKDCRALRLLAVVKGSTIEVLDFASSVR